ncbi:MAG: UxaA family hydrolase [Promethearchaeota archaeon]
MDSNDNCATALVEIPKNSEIMVKERNIKTNQKIPNGHKVALIDIKKGEFILKYGEIIGVAIEDIKSGDWMHIHNIKSHYLNKVTE